MAILVTPDTRILVQGITGDFGARHAQLSLDYGTQLVAGVTPGKGGQIFRARRIKVPIFDTVAEAARETGATASAIFVPPPFAADAILECVDAGLDLVVAITEGIPVNDMVKVKRAMQGSRPGSSVRTAPASSRPAPAKNRTAAAASASRPATFTRKATSASSRAAARSPTKPCGSSPRAAMARAPASASAAIRSTAPRTLDVLKMFNDDPETEAIIMIGEIGGTAEEEAAAWAKENCRKPIAAFIAGATAPPGRRMGHAGAIVAAAKARPPARSRRSRPRASPSRRRQQ